ncbi:MAG TPA: hypothetical protein VIR04_06150 [Paralcaligenes sp.]
MDIFYSGTTRGFYRRDIHGESIPADAVEITREKHAALLQAQSDGKTIEPDENGFPIAVEPPALTAAQIWEGIKAERDRRSQQSGFQCVGKWFHSDSISKTQHLGNKDTARDQLDEGGAMDDALVDPATGENIVWKTMDGTWQPLTCQIAFDIVKAGKGAEFAHYRAAEMHRVAMEASAQPAEYDYSTGWPLAFGE